VSSVSPVPIATRAHCEAFASAAEALARRQAQGVPEEDIRAFLALGWIEWRQGVLRVTPLGQMALIRIQAAAAQPA